MNMLVYDIFNKATVHTNYDRPHSERLSEILSFMPVQTFEYWSSHFAAVLQCLHNHTYLKYKPHNLINYPDWSIADLRGNYEYHFFNELQTYINNWGFQYFLLNFLNHPSSVIIVQTIAQALHDEYQAKFLSELNYYKYVMSGTDSLLTDKVLLNKTRTFLTSNSSSEVNYHIADNSDLAIIFSNGSEANFYDSLAVYGEVEGNDGKTLLTERFWRRKHPDCLFGIGITPSRSHLKKFGFSKKHFKDITPSITLNWVKVDRKYKIVILIEKEHAIVQDFYDSIQAFKDILIQGRSYRAYSQFNAPFKEATNILFNGLHTPIPLLLQQFKLYSDPELIIEVDDPARKLQEILRIDG
ncbi:hypothetical protein OHW82_11375 [Acinetobacter baumannii]|nr:hypothetical protein [Acinetobacter baumannii]